VPIFSPSLSTALLPRHSATAESVGVMRVFLPCWFRAGA
jgi:hypothetical protein